MAAWNKGNGSRAFKCEVCATLVVDKPYRRKRTCSKACKDQLSHIYRGAAHWNYTGGTKPYVLKGPRPREHGQYVTYKAGGCRCDLCVKAHDDRIAGNRARATRWRINNPERYAANQKIGRARRRGAPGDYTAEDLENLLKAQKYKCAYCRASIRRKASRQLDHIKALSKGGTNHLSNLQWCCGFCNSSKHDRDPLEFAQSIGRLC